MTEFDAPGAELRDNDLINPDDVKQRSVYDRFRETVSKPVQVEDKPLDVPSREDIKILVRPDIDFDLLEKFTDAATDKRKGKFSPLRFAYSVIAMKTVGIMFEGELMQDEEGQNLNFTHAQFKEIMGAFDTTDAIRKLYGQDGPIIQTGGKIVEMSGFDDFDLESGDNPL